MTKTSKPSTGVVKPGQKDPPSGQYVPVTPGGKPAGNEITHTTGKPLPPTQKPGGGFVLVDKTKHSGDKKK